MFFNKGAKNKLYNGRPVTAAADSDKMLLFKVRYSLAQKRARPVSLFARVLCANYAYSGGGVSISVSGSSSAQRKQQRPNGALRKHERGAIALRAQVFHIKNCCRLCGCSCRIMDDKNRKEMDDDLKAGSSAARAVVAPTAELRSNLVAMGKLEAKVADAKVRLEKKKAEDAAAAAAAEAAAATAETTAALKSHLEKKDK